MAILPLTSLSRFSDDDYFADGLTEELITELAKMGSFRVISRTSAMLYKGSSKSIPQIGRDLNVAAVVTGAVRRSGNRIRVTAQLIRTSPERQIWGDTFEEDIGDVLALQREIASDIAVRLQSKLMPQITVTSGGRKRLDPEAYQDYLLGRHFLDDRSGAVLSNALMYFHRSLDRDPKYAQPLAAMAEIYNLQGAYEYSSPGESYRHAKQYATLALDLDNTLAEAYTARAVAAAFGEFDWASAERDFKRALSCDPSSANAHHWYGQYLNNIGKLDRAISEFKLALQSDPVSAMANGVLGRAYHDAGRYPEAVQQCLKALEL